ncbi:MAG TPA: GNAT family N-acetyltransferase [Myxococcota bacterium]|jgi:GNAT superfamily N-acetyltransferase|nr:GNAT family N-acetyltransferase [Myxococcota bacterium]
MKLLRVGMDEVELVVPLFDAYRQFYEQPSDPTGGRSFLFARVAREESVIFLARDEDGRARGFVQLYPTFSSVSLGARWILNDLYVSPEARRSGVGSALLQKAADHARHAGANALVLATAEDNLPAQRLYEARGWKRDGFFHYVLAL